MAGDQSCVCAWHVGEDNVPNLSACVKWLEINLMCVHGMWGRV